MKKIIADPEASFFTQNGFVELEIDHEKIPYSPDRDQWRTDKGLEKFLIKAIGPIALELTGKKRLRLGMSEWVTQENRPPKSGSLKELFSIQNVTLAVAMASNPNPCDKKSSLGILPVPASPSNILFFRPDLLLDWPHVLTDLFLILFTLPNAVYIRNPKDPRSTYLKTFGYQYGDLLRTETHPLIFAY